MIASLLSSGTLVKVLNLKYRQAQKGEGKQVPYLRRGGGGRESLSHLLN